MKTVTVYKCMLYNTASTRNLCDLTTLWEWGERENSFSLKALLAVSFFTKVNGITESQNN